MVEPILLGLAFGAGVLSFFSPCSLPLLPAYALYYVGRKAPSARPQFSPASFALLALLGILFLFVILAVAVSLVRACIPPDVAPLLKLPIGVALVILGVVHLAGGHLGFTPSLRAPAFAGLAGAFLFGIAYALVSLGCALPLFLLASGTALLAGVVVEGFLLVFVYAAGFGLLMVVFTLGVAASRDFVLQGYRRLLPSLRPVGALVLMAAGAYLLLQEFSLCPY